MLHVICTGLQLGHLSVRVGDSSQRSEESVKKFELRLSMRLLLLDIVCHTSPQPAGSPSSSSKSVVISHR